MEGIIGKSRFCLQWTRNGDWIKLKCGKSRNSSLEDIRCPIKIRGVRSLLLGIYEGEKLVMWDAQAPALAKQI